MVGAGKTTLLVDLACHLAARDDWLGIPIGGPVPRGDRWRTKAPGRCSRAKLRRKRNAWQGSPIEDRAISPL
jgi:hypothetical protein